MKIQIPRRNGAPITTRSGAQLLHALQSHSEPETSESLATSAKKLQDLHPGCVFLPPSTNANSYRRRITFVQTKTDFELGSDVVNQDGDVFNPNATGAANPDTIGPETFPDPIDWATTPHICPVLGAEEVWELVNTTDEMHNFHIHQSKFRLASGQIDSGIPSGLVAKVASGADCDAAAGKLISVAFCDPLGLTSEDMIASGGVTPSEADAWHDTIPVPPRDSNGPGRVFVSIPFKAAEQQGRFVFHCHILEHEDGGMMAPVEVLGPDTIALLQRHETISMGGHTNEMTNEVNHSHSMHR